MGKLKEMMMAAYEEYEEASEYEFYVWMVEEQRKNKEQKNKSAQDDRADDN
jgi:hypothetical protein